MCVYCSREELTRYWRSLPLTGNNVVVDLIVTDMVTSQYHTAFFLRPNTLPCNCGSLLDYYLEIILDNILFHRAFERLPPCFTQGVFEVCEERGLTLIEIGEGVGVDDIRAATGTSFQVHNRG